MKKLFKLFVSFTLIICAIFVLTNSKVNESISIGASSELVAVTDDNGNIVYHRNSNEAVMRLKEYNYPTQNLRACWVSNFIGSLPNYSTEEKWKADYTYVLDKMEKYGLNCIIFHVRTHNNALYKSELNPVASWFANVNFDEFDPLEWAIEETHKRGIEFHAWLNPYRISTTGGQTQYVSGSIPEVNPVNDSSNLLQNGNSIILNPGLQSNRDFIVDSCMEVVENYDVDAIHFDDYFYISGVETSKSGDWKRQQVDLFIEQLSNELRSYNAEHKKAVQLGISPSGIYQNGGYSTTPKYDSNGNLVSPLYSNTSGFAHYGDYLYSDTLKWINEEWIDYIMPQTYWSLEQTVAQFGSLSRWWSWAVANKDVNLYLGLGIYMPESNSNWCKNKYEVRDQVLNAEMYDEVGGFSFYSYNYLDSSNVYTKTGMDILKHDYFSVKIPCDVKKYYANIYDTVNVVNVQVNNDVLSFDECENVRGYVVYKVKRGDILDQENINHIYYYGTETTIELDDTINYDYYVSSVNLANEISTPTKYGESLDQTELLIKMIDSLPEKITLVNENQVNTLVSTYNSLSAEDKAKITNYAKLQAAIEQIQAIKALENEVDEYLKSVNTHISGDYKLPTNSNVSWSYANVADAQYYNIATGKKLLYPLAQTYMDLIITYNKGDLTYSKEVQFNIGYLSDTQTGLFYRDDASCMSPVDKGAYTEESTKYIGWSGYTLTKDNKVLFIAVDSVHIIENASKIENCYWTSCAGVYKNATSSNVTMTIGNAFSSATNYGHFVIGTNNVVKSVSNTSQLTDSVTLQPGEVLVIARYLDVIITNTFLHPSSGTPAVGDTVKLEKVEFETITENEKVQMVIAEIEALPSTITLNNENAITSARLNYDSLTQDQKSQVTNYSKLQQAERDLAALKEAEAELAKLKQEYYQNAVTYSQLHTYSAINQEKVTNELNKFHTSLSTAKSESDLKRLFAEFKSKIDAIPTYEDELKEYVSEMTAKLIKYVDLNNYKNDQHGYINYLIEYYVEAMEESQTKESVDTYFLEACDLLNEIKTKAQYLAEAKETAKSNIDSTEIPSTVTSAQAEHITKMKTDTKALIDAASTEEEVSVLVSSFSSEIEKYISDMASAVENAISYFESKKTDDSNTSTIITKYSELVQNASSINDISQLIREFDIEIEPYISTPAPKKGCQKKAFALVEILTALAVVFIFIKKK